MDGRIRHEEIVHLAGDMRSGLSVTHDFTKTALGTVELTYTGRFAHPLPKKLVRCEIYEQGGRLAVHTICPRCARAQWIDGGAKRIEFDASRNLLFIEPFTCTWELEDHRQGFGVGLCRTRVAYDGREVKDA